MKLKVGAEKGSAAAFQQWVSDRMDRERKAPDKDKEPKKE